MNNNPFEQYLTESEPEKRVKSYAWHTAVGLQKVDGLVVQERNYGISGIIFKKSAVGRK